MRTSSEIIESLKIHGWVEVPTARVFQSSQDSGVRLKVVLPEGCVIEGKAYFEHDYHDSIPYVNCPCIMCEAARSVKM